MLVAGAVWEPRIPGFACEASLPLAPLSALPACAVRRRWDAVVDDVVAFLSICMILASSSTGGRWRLGTRPGPAAKELLSAAPRRCFLQMLKQMRRGVVGRGSMSSCLNQLRDHLGNWNSAFRMQDINSNQAFRPGLTCSLISPDRAVFCTWFCVSSQSERGDWLCIRGNEYFLVLQISSPLW